MLIGTLCLPGIVVYHLLCESYAGCRDADLAPVLHCRHDDYTCQLKYVPPPWYHYPVPALGAVLAVFVVWGSVAWLGRRAKQAARLTDARWLEQQRENAVMAR